MEEISTSKNINLNNEPCNMCLQFHNNYVTFTCKHKICLKCFYKILIRSYIKDISINNEIKIICVCNKGNLTMDLNSIYNDLNELFKNNTKNNNEINSKYEEKCETHPINNITDFCLDCREYICEKCKENNFHYEHNIQNINDYIKNIKDKINKLPELTNYLNEYEESLNNYYEEYLNDINSKIDNLINEIQNYKKNSLNLIKNKIDSKILPMKICLLLYKYYNYEIQQSSNDIHQLLFLLNTKITFPEINYQKYKTKNDIDNLIKSVYNLHLDKRVIVKFNNKFCNFKNFQNLENSHNKDINILIKISGNKIVSGDSEGYIKIWKISGKGIFNIQSEKAHENQVQSIIGLNDKRFASCSGSETFILLWKENNENNIYRIIQKIDLTNKICLVLNKLNDNNSLLISLNDNKIYIFKNNGNNDYFQDKIIGSHEGTINCLIQLKNNLIVSGSDDKTIIIWNEKKRQSILKGHKDSINVIIEIDNENFCSGSSDNNIIIWKKNSSSKYENYSILEGHTNSIKCLAYLKDKRIISGSADTTIKVWLLSRKGYICSFTIEEHNSSISGLIGINDDLFISSSYDKSIKVWVSNK